MFVKSIDNKKTYIDANGIEVVDIGESFINAEGQSTSLYSIYKVPKDMEMRPDKISISAYGSDEYTEMVCAFNAIKNPFTIEENDLVYMISLNNIYDNTYEPTSEVISTSNSNGYEVFRNFLDKSRLPNTVGSQKNSTVVGKSTKYISSSSKNNLSTSGILSEALNSISGVSSTENSGTVNSTSGTYLPPNVAGYNTSAIEIVNNKIIYGANNDNYTSNANVSTSYSAKYGSSALNNIQASSHTSHTQIKSENAAKILEQKASTAVSNNQPSTNAYSVNSASSVNPSILASITNAIIDMEDAIPGIDSLLSNLGVSSLSSVAPSIANKVVELGITNPNNITPELVYALAQPDGSISSIIASTYQQNNVANNSEDSSIIDNTVKVNNGTVSFAANNTIGCSTEGESLGNFVTDRINNEI